MSANIKKEHLTVAPADKIVEFRALFGVRDLRSLTDFKCVRMQDKIYTFTEVKPLRNAEGKECTIRNPFEGSRWRSQPVPYWPRNCIANQFFDKFSAHEFFPQSFFGP
jgi:hypothetical protein